MISLFSLLNILYYFFPLTGKPALFFTNTILQGIISGIAALIFLFYLLKKFNLLFAVLLTVNSGGVFFSRSKAAFIGCVLFALLLIVLKNRKFIIIPAILTILTFIIPNPIKDTFDFSLKKDPYAFDRVHIWQVSIDIFKNNLFTGVGPDNFSEVSKKYNFKQTKGPAQYFKVPRQSHNDYLKIMAETGLPGLLILSALLFFIFRKIFSSSLFDITKILLLYLMFQAFLFNIIFHAFFFLLFIFLLKMLFEQDLVFKSFHLNTKVVSFCSLLFIFTICYLFPFLANVSIEKSKANRRPVESLNSLEKAVYFNPLSIDAYYLQALYFYNYFSQTANLDYFGQALEKSKKVQRLNPHFTDSYLLESDLYHLLSHKFESGYVSLDEIIMPLVKAEKIAPLQPYLKMRKAQVYLEFNKKEAAKEEALNALKVEPHFIAALYFLHRNFNYFKDENIFKLKLKDSLKIAGTLSLAPGTYLYELYKVPEELKQ
jgi:tetratricopeptide (TPR) repeat protein